MTASPTTDQTVDTTGWELDHLAQMISQVSFDLHQGNDRPMTANEIEALEDDALGLPIGASADPEDWWISDPQVTVAVDSLGPIVDEAIFQRDLAAALARLAAGLELTVEQRDAYGRYAAGL